MVSSSTFPSSSQRETTLMTLLEPIIRVNQLFGVCPHEISGGMMIFRWRSFKVVHTIFTFTVLLFYFTFLLYRFTHSFSPSPTIGINSTVFYTEPPPMSDLVSVGLWLGGTLIPLCLLIVTFYKRYRFTLFFEKMFEYKGPLKGIMRCQKPIQFSRKLYAFYVILCLTSCARVTFVIINSPFHDISILNIFYSRTDPTPPPRMAIALCIAFQCYMVIIKYSASTFIEVLSSSLARSFVATTRNIISELSKSSECTNRQFNSNSKVSGILMRHQEIHPMQKDMSYHPHIHRVTQQNSVDLLQDNNCSGTPYNPIILDCQSQQVGNPINNLSSSFSMNPCYSPSGYEPAVDLSNEDSSSGTTPIILALRRFNCIANMQRLINCIFGLILALDTALLVFMCCLLLFLQINYLGSSDSKPIDGIIHFITATCVFIRLIIIFVNLGNVHEVSTCFNGVITSSLMQARNPKPTDVSLILAHLSNHSTNPVAYSAGGFFIFCRGSLLTVISVITTYVVFLMQAKN